LLILIVPLLSQPVYHFGLADFYGLKDPVPGMFHPPRLFRWRRKRTFGRVLTKVFPCAACLIWSLAALRLHARAPETIQYRYDAWKIEQGLPQNTAKVIFQTKDGYLWFSTRFGIVRFDGVNFHVFDRANTPEIGDENGIAMAEEADGTFWIATWQGVVCYKNRVFQYYRLSRRGTDDRLWTICPNRQGGIWAATSDGLITVKPGQPPVHYSTQDGLTTNLVTAVREDQDGTLWVGTEL